jgi:DNA polymerase-3 subunit alpha
MTTLEELGLLKIDLLGLRNLTVIENAVKTIRKTNHDFNMEAIPLDDQKVFAMLSAGDSQGVFQFESAGMKRVLSRLQPTSIEDLTAALALYRPGPMKSIGTYIENRHHPEKVSYLTPELEPILKVTYGCLVYQEQVMQVCRSLGGYTYGHADVVRRAMSKKKHDVMEKERTAFVAGAKERGIDQSVANKVFDNMTDFASYAFNKSHAVAYAVVAYRTAYLKCHYPLEYMAALLSSVMGSDKVADYIRESKRKGIAVVPPNVNRSQTDFSVSNQQIVFGLLAVKNVGIRFIEEILRNRREQGPFTDYYDFCRRLQGKDLNRRNLESLIKCGALDGLADNRRQMLLSVDLILNALGNDRRGNIEGQIGFFDLPGSRQEFVLPPAEEFDRNTLLAMEKETTGIYISGHPLDAYETLEIAEKTTVRDIVKEDSLIKDGDKAVLLCTVTGLRTTLTKKNETMAYLQLEDVSGIMEALVFPKVYGSCVTLLKEGTVCVVSGRISTREERGHQLICDRLESPDRYRKSTPKNKEHSRWWGLHLQLDAPQSGLEKQVLNMLEKHQGNMPVYIKYKQTGKRVLLSENRYVTVTPVLQKTLEELVGKENLCIMD